MKAVSAWTTSDNQVFTDAKLAKAHELRVLRKAALAETAEKISEQLDKQCGGGALRVDGKTVLNVLLDNADAVLAGLSVKIATNRGRKAKSEAAAA